MNFFRGNLTTISIPIELEVDTMELPKIRRGTIFFDPPPPLTNAQSIETEGKTLALRHWRHTDDRQLQTPQLVRVAFALRNRQLRAIDWRW